MAEKVLFQTALTAIEETDVEGVGALRTDAQGRVYRWVRNYGAASTTNDLVAGQPVCYSDAQGADTRYQGVIDTVSAGDEEMLAGVAMAALTALYYGWIQVKGVCITASVSSAGAANIVIGDALALASAGESLIYGAAGGGVPSNAAAVAWEALASAGTSASSAKTVMLNCAY